MIGRSKMSERLPDMTPNRWDAGKKIQQTANFN